MLFPRDLEASARLVEEVQGAGRPPGATDPLQRALLEARAELLSTKDRLRNLEQAVQQAEEAAKVRKESRKRSCYIRVDFGTG